MAVANQIGLIVGCCEDCLILLNLIFIFQRKQMASPTQDYTLKRNLKRIKKRKSEKHCFILLFIYGAIVLVAEQSAKVKKVEYGDLTREGLSANPAEIGMVVLFKQMLQQ